MDARENRFYREKQQDDGGPAFPNALGPEDFEQKGMTLRDWFAGQALAQYLATMPSDATYAELAEKCYRAADAMLEARGK